MVVVAAVMLVAGARRSQALPVVAQGASVPAITPMPRPAAAQFMAGLAAGIPVWPGVLLADSAAAHLAQVELRQVRASP